MDPQRLLYRLSIAGSPLVLVIAALAWLWGAEGWSVALALVGAAGFVAAFHFHHLTIIGRSTLILRDQRATATQITKQLSDLEERTVDASLLAERTHQEFENLRSELERNARTLQELVAQQGRAERLQHLVEEVAGMLREGQATSDATTSLATEVNDKLDVVRSETRGIRQTMLNATGALRKGIEQLPSTMDEYTRLRQLLAPDSGDLPTLGGWALTGPMVISIAHAIMSSKGPMNVAELGSGGSTLWIALALKASPHQGHCWSLEQEAPNAKQTRQRLDLNNVADYATVLDAPLAQLHLGTETYEWYDTRSLQELPGQINLLLVDGPRGKAGEQVRYPALPVLLDRLAPGALVYLDDTIRQMESDILSRWMAENPELQLLEDLGKGTLLRFGNV